MCDYSSDATCPCMLFVQTEAEYIEKFNGFRKSEEELEIPIMSFQLPPHYNGSSLPTSVNWQKKGVVTKVKRQVCSCVSARVELLRV